VTALLVTGDTHLVDPIANFENYLIFHDFSQLTVVVKPHAGLKLLSHQKGLRPDDAENRLPKAGERFWFVVVDVEHS
jgi:hypothetical protein